MDAYAVKRANDEVVYLGIYFCIEEGRRYGLPYHKESRSKGARVCQ